LKHLLPRDACECSYRDFEISLVNMFWEKVGYGTGLDLNMLEKVISARESLSRSGPMYEYYLENP